MPNGIGTNVKLKTTWIGKFVINGSNPSLPERKISGHGHSDIGGNFKRFSKPMPHLTREKMARSTTAQMFKNDSSFKRKKRNGIGSRLRYRNVQPIADQVCHSWLSVQLFDLAHPAVITRL